MRRLWQIWLQPRRLRHFEAGLLDTLPLFISGLRAGHSLYQCLALAAQRRRGPFSREMAVIDERWRRGQPLPEILAERLAAHPSREYRLFCSAILLCCQAGGSLGPVFESLEETLRQRQMLREKILALTAQARAQAWLISLLSPGFLLALQVIDPSYTAPLYHSRAGWGLLLAASLLTILGFMISLKISQPPPG